MAYAWSKFSIQFSNISTKIELINIKFGMLIPMFCI